MSKFILPAVLALSLVLAACTVWKDGDGLIGPRNPFPSAEPSCYTIYYNGETETICN